ncbi:hypothetical protein ScalyP_jg10056 [Parmales sp. scaly parma]|nr:hypothetical protein ScalyP_jg10056 [Parmales sp. scaly parma]
MFNDEVKQDSCRSCNKFGVKNSFVSSSDSPPSFKLSCICSKGDFRVLLNSSSAVLVAECQPCEGVTSDSGISKEGLICNEVGLTTETLELSPGYWRSGNSSVKIEMCENVGDCPQKNATQQCADGHEGPICANCLPGHTRLVSGGCEECEETSSSSMLALLACLIPLSLILSRVLKRRMKNTSIADVHNKKHWANRLKTKVKILSSSFQIVCEFAATLKVSFPPVFSGFTKWVSTIVQFDFISIGSFGCMVDTNYYGSLLLYTLAPIVITLLLVVYILLGKVMHRSDKLKQKEIFDNCFTFFLTMTFAVYAVMSAAKEAARNENEDEGAAIEMGEIYKGGRESSFENVNPMARSSSGWVEFVDESSGAKYLFNEKTGETKWE